MKVRTTSRKSLATVADFLATVFRGGMTIGLQGPLGAGKTTFMSELVRALGGRDPVSSPTFVLCHEYRTAAAYSIEHWDLYRLTSGVPPELYEPPSESVLRCIEWPERAADLPVDAVVHFARSATGRAGRVARTIESALLADYKARGSRL
jgi:tRNA threonylcarbamoyl adenosine modification protein YjeE